MHNSVPDSDGKCSLNCSVWIRNRIRILLFICFRSGSGSYMICKKFSYINFTFVFQPFRCFRLHITTRYKLFREFFLQKGICIFKFSILLRYCQILPVFQKSFISNSFRIRSFPDPYPYPDRDPTKSFGSDRIQINNTAELRQETAWDIIRQTYLRWPVTLVSVSPRADLRNINS